MVQSASSSEVIRSRQNAAIKRLRAGFASPTSLPAGNVVLEGASLIAEAARSGCEIEGLFVREGSERLLEQIIIPPSVECRAVSEDVFDSAVSTESPQGLAAVVKLPGELWDGSLEDILRPKDSLPLLIIAAGLQDPGNFGTLIRSAEAFGCDGVLSTPGTVSAWNPKTVRASAGSVFRLPVIKLTGDFPRKELTERAIKLYAAVAAGGKSPMSAKSPAAADLTGACAFLIGTEGAGLAPEMVKMADEALTIPFCGAVESLNAAVAASILLYEAARQRSFAGKQKPGQSLSDLQGGR